MPPLFDRLLQYLPLPRILSPLPDLLLAIAYGLPPTLRALWADPGLIVHFKRLQEVFQANFWVVFGPEVDKAAAPVKVQLLPYAQGVVLEIGAGHGHSLKYMQRAKISKYYALEPNTDMWPGLRKALVEAGYSEEKGDAVILPYGAGDIGKIAEHLGGDNTVDSLVSILVFCCVPGAKDVLPALCQRLLKKGGSLLMYEHCLSPVPSSRLYQRLWTPIWSIVFDGCRLDKDTMGWVNQVKWSDKHIWRKEGEPEWSLFFHGIGRFTM
ncbi:hypothetical protein CALCODRAFT_435645 [Calocera cornea HHB12733]|uniref:Methyltransferase type 11 domain-containing protein n=1 Tax=Calocera cornea HHB12733 TaxID=1353952 RepID=A0A165FC94_9BASI|nr:hypothetical protein CALCODRAFT_435645 [Calocera cornea HHB12733]